MLEPYHLSSPQLSPISSLSPSQTVQVASTVSTGNTLLTGMPVPVGTLAHCSMSSRQGEDRTRIESQLSDVSEPFRPKSAVPSSHSLQLSAWWSHQTYDSCDLFPCSRCVVASTACLTSDLSLRYGWSRFLRSINRMQHQPRPAISPP
jgi:hypothetical protein